MTEKKITSELVVPKEGEIKVRFEKKKKELGGLRESLDAMGERANHLKEELRLLEEELATIDTAGDEETDAVKLQLTNLEIKITNFGKKIDRTKKVIEVKERNEKVFQSLEQALALIKKKLEGLSDEEGRGLKWIVRSIEYALSNKGEDGRIEVKDEDGNLQREGVPVDQLIEELKKIKNDAEETEKKNKEIGLLRERINYLNKARQNSREGEAVYFLVLGKDHINGDDKIPDFLKPFIAKRPELLARFDVGLKHDDKYKYHDTGSAAHDLVEYLAIETEKELVSLESSGDREAEAKRLAEFLTKHSKGYFELRPEMKGEKQHWRTRLEARLISSDHRSTGGVESDYKKAMETMSARRELVLEDIPEIIVEPEVEPVKPPEVEPVKPPEVEPVKPPEPIKLERSRLVMVNAVDVAARLAWTESREHLDDILRRGISERPKLMKERSGWFKKALGKVLDFGVEMAYSAKDLVVHPIDRGRAIWYRLAESGYRERYRNQMMAEIQKDPAVLANLRASMDKRPHPIASEDGYDILDMAVGDFVEQVESARERGEVVRDDEINAEVNEILYDYVIGNTTARGDFQKRVQAIGEKIAVKGGKFTNDKKTGELSSQGEVFASNLLDLAKKCKTEVAKVLGEISRESGVEKEKVMEIIKAIWGCEIQLGLKIADVHTSKSAAKRELIDRIVDSSQNNTIFGKLLANPSALAAGFTGGALLLARGVAGAGLRTVMSVPVVGALVGGVFTGMRRYTEEGRNREVEDVRATVGQIPGGEKSEKMREFVHQKMEIDSALDRLLAIMEMSPGAISSEDKSFVAEVYGRLWLDNGILTEALDYPGDVGDINLFSSKLEEGKKYKTRLESMTRLKVIVRELVKKHPELSPDKIDFEVQKFVTNFSDEFARVNKAFAKMRRASSFRAAAFGAVVGYVAGAAVEAGYGLLNGNYGTTTIGRLFSENSASPGPMHTEILPGGASVRIPDGLHAEVIDGKHFVIADASRDAVFKFENAFSASGLKPEVLAEMQQQGWATSVNIDTVPGEFFSSNMHEVFVPGATDVKFQLPEGWTIVDDGSGSLSIVEEGTGREFVSGLRLAVDGKSFDPASMDMLRDTGFSVNTNTDVITTNLTDSARILSYLRGKFGESDTNEIVRRVWHGNKNITGEVTSVRNTDLRLLSREGHYPYEQNVTADQAAESVRLKGSGLARETIAAGETLKGDIFDGREIMGHAYVRNGAGVLDFRRGLQDVLNNGALNQDGTHDYLINRLSHALRSGNFARVTEHCSFRGYLNAEDYSAGRAVSFAMGPDGKFTTTDPELIRTLFTPDGKLQMYRLEFAINNGTKNVADILATAKGPGIDSLPVQEEISTISLGHEVIPGSENVDMLMTPPDDMPFLLPFPWAKRHLMEPGRFKDVETPYGYGGSKDYGWLKGEEYRAMMSKTIRENPRAILDESKEIRDYLARVDNKHREFVSGLADSLPPMEKECRLVVCFPAYKEGERIYKSLQTYLNQKTRDGKPLDYSTFEILIFDNHPKSVPKDKTEDEIERFKSEHPEVRIRYIHHAFEKKMPIGYYRKVVHDVALTRMLASNEKEGVSGDHIIVSQDADREYLNPTYMAEILHGMDEKHPNADAFGGMTDYPKEAMAELPLLFASKRLWTMLDLWIQTKMKGHPELIGRNSGWRADIYAAIGGNNERCTLAEDIETGYRIRMARGWNPDSVKFLAQVKEEGDPRRGIATMMSGGALADQYGDWVENESIRDKNWEELMRENRDWSKISREQLQKEFKSVYFLYRRGISNPSDVRRLKEFFVKSADWIGVECHFVGDSDEIKIDGFSKLTEGVEDYQSDEKPNRFRVKKRTARPPKS